MRLRPLGRSGLYVSELCLGTMTFGSSNARWQNIGQIGQSDADAQVRTALDAGINFIDSANTYHDGASEQVLGRALKNLGIPRDEVVIATKVMAPVGKGPNACGASRRHILDQCRKSLERLSLDHIDLYQLHSFDPVTPIDETLEALDSLVRQGYVRYIGLSNWAAWQVVKAVGIAEARRLAPVLSLQSFYTLVNRDVEREIVPMLLSERMGMMVWSPLAGGYLTGKYEADDAAQGRRNTGGDAVSVDPVRGPAALAELRRIAEAKGCTMAQVAIAWLLHQPVVTSVLVGATRLEQLTDNIRATDIALDPADLAALEAVGTPTREYPGWIQSRNFRN